MFLYKNLSCYMVITGISLVFFALTLIIFKKFFEKLDVSHVD